MCGLCALVLYGFCMCGVCAVCELVCGVGLCVWVM